MRSRLFTTMMGRAALAGLAPPLPAPLFLVPCIVVLPTLSVLPFIFPVAFAPLGLVRADQPLRDGCPGLPVHALDQNSIVIARIANGSLVIFSYDSQMTFSNTTHLRV